MANTCCEIRDSLELLDSMKEVTYDEPSPTIGKKKKGKSGADTQMERACDRLSTPQRAQVHSFCAPCMLIHLSRLILFFLPRLIAASALNTAILVSCVRAPLKPQLKNLMNIGRENGKTYNNIPSDVATSSLITIPDFPCAGALLQTATRRSSASKSATSSSLTMPTIEKGNFSQKLAPRRQSQPMEWSPPGGTTTPEGDLSLAMVGLAQDRERNDCSTRNSEPKGGKDCKISLRGKTESVLPPPALVRQNSDTLVKLMRETSLAANDANNQPYLKGGIPAFLLSPIQLPYPPLRGFGLPSSSPLPVAAAAVTEIPTSERFFSGRDRENAGSFLCNSEYNGNQGEGSKPYSDCAGDPVDLPLELPAINTTVSQDISDFMNSGWKPYKGRKSI